VDGSVTSNTFVNYRGTLAGIGTINGNVVNNGRLSPGSAGAPGMLTVVGNYTQTQYATLMVQIAGTNTGDFSVLNVVGNTNLNGFLDPVLLNGFVPTLGQTFPFLDYASLTGEFARIKHRVFDNGTLAMVSDLRSQSWHPDCGTARAWSGFNISAPDVGLARLGGVSATVVAGTVLSIGRLSNFQANRPPLRAIFVLIGSNSRERRSIYHSQKIARKFKGFRDCSGLVEHTNDRGMRAREKFRVMDRVINCLRSLKP
jgi:hypothetical protein